MRLLALDLGTRTGWCLVETAESGRAAWTCGYMDFRNQRHEGGGMRFLRFRNWLHGVLDAHGPEAIVYEEVRRHLGTDAAHIYGGLLAHLQATCEGRRVPYRGLPIGTIKKRATGKGNAPKEAMLQAARQHWPHLEIADDNVADALWIAQLGVEELG